MRDEAREIKERTKSQPRVRYSERKRFPSFDRPKLRDNLGRGGVSTEKKPTHR